MKMKYKDLRCILREKTTGGGEQSSIIEMSQLQGRSQQGRLQIPILTLRFWWICRSNSLTSLPTLELSLEQNSSLFVYILELGERPIY